MHNLHDEGNFTPLWPNGQQFLVNYHPIHSIMWLLHPCPRANTTYAALGTHYAALGLHYAALGLPRPTVYGSPLAA